MAVFLEPGMAQLAWELTHRLGPGDFSSSPRRHLQLSVRGAISVHVLRWCRARPAGSHLQGSQLCHLRPQGEHSRMMT